MTEIKHYKLVREDVYKAVFTKLYNDSIKVNEDETITKENTLFHDITENLLIKITNNTSPHEDKEATAS